MVIFLDMHGHYIVSILLYPISPCFQYLTLPHHQIHLMIKQTSQHSLNHTISPGRGGGGASNTKSLYSRYQLHMSALTNKCHKGPSTDMIVITCPSPTSQAWNFIPKIQIKGWHSKSPINQSRKYKRFCRNGFPDSLLQVTAAIQLPRRHNN